MEEVGDRGKCISVNEDIWENCNDKNEFGLNQICVPIVYFLYLYMD